MSGPGKYDPAYVEAEIGRVGRFLEHLRSLEAHSPEVEARYASYLEELLLIQEDMAKEETG